MAAPRLESDEVILVPKPYAAPTLEQTIVERYKKLRLHGLQVDPQSFSSTYEDESQFADEVWLSRIYNPAGKTFAAVTCSDNQPENTTETLVQAHDTNDALQRFPGKEWVGIVTLLGPGGFSRSNEDAATAPTQPYEVFLRNGKYQTPPKSSEVDDLTSAHVVYLIVGMFVSPSARRRGHGQRLMETAIAAATTEARKLGGCKVSITLQVSSSNLHAQRLYEKVGFKVVAEGVVVENRHGAKNTVVCLEMEVAFANLDQLFS